MQDSSTTSNSLHEIVDRINTISREPVFDEIFFFDNIDRENEPHLELSIAELTSSVWRKSYEIFEEVLYRINTYFLNKCDKFSIELIVSNYYDRHMRILFNLKNLNDYQFIILNKMEKDDLIELTHEFRLRLRIDDLETYVISRNLVYLTFINLLEYVDNIDESSLYGLIIVTFLLMYILENKLIHIKDNTDTIDYSIYEIAKILSKDKQLKFENLVSDSLMIYDRVIAEKMLEELILEIFEVSNPTQTDSLEGRIDKIVHKYTVRDDSNNHIHFYLKRKEMIEQMYLIDVGKVEEHPMNMKSEESEIFESIISSKSIPDRFKSDFKKSHITKNNIPLLVSSHQCKASWVKGLNDQIDIQFHIHQGNVTKEHSKCMIAIDLPILQYFKLLPTIHHDDIVFLLVKGNYVNSRSHIAMKSGPSIDAIRFSPKLGLSKPRAKQRVVIETAKNILKRDNLIRELLLKKPENIIEIGENLTESIDCDRFKLKEQLTVLEDLLFTNLINAYELQVFENYSIIFISFDIDQEEHLRNQAMDENLVIKINKLLHASNVCIVPLFE